MSSLVDTSKGRTAQIVVDELRSQSLSEIEVWINGTKHRIEEPDPEMTLLEYLRNVARLTGTKLGCGEGGCGACTVMVSQRVLDQASCPETISKMGLSATPRHVSLNACLLPLCALDRAHVVTVEGIGDVKKGLHPVQKRISAMHGSQCGFCTPGIVMALYTLLRNHPEADPHFIQENMDGNLCRCTGYRPILDAAKSLTEATSAATPTSTSSGGCCGGGGGGGGGGGCCGGRCVGGGGDKPKMMEHSSIDALAEPSLKAELRKSNGSEPIFPPALAMLKADDYFRPLWITTSSGDRGKNPVGSDTGAARQCRWVQPATLEHLLALKALHPSARIVVGNTEVGIETKFKGVHYGTLLSPRAVPELRRLGVGTSAAGQATAWGLSGDGSKGAWGGFSRGARQSLSVGAAVTLGELEHFLHRFEADAATQKTSLKSSEADSSVSPLVPWKARVCFAMRHMLRWFASNQIRAGASLAGNLATASPISDMNPVLAALDATIVVAKFVDPAAHEHTKKPSSALVETKNGGGSSSSTMATCEFRTIAVRDFFLGYRRVDLAPSEVIVRVDIPLPSSPFDFVQPYKQARRREDDISIVSGAIRVVLEPSDDMAHWQVAQCGMAFGGMAPTTVTARKAMAALVGKPWSLDSLGAAYSAMAEDMPLPDDVPGGQAQYRRALPPSFLFKFFVKTCQDLALQLGSVVGGKQMPPAPTLAPSVASAAANFVTASKPHSSGVQRYSVGGGGLTKGANGIDDEEEDGEEEKKKAESGGGSGAGGAVATKGHGKLKPSEFAVHIGGEPMAAKAAAEAAAAAADKARAAETGQNEGETSRTPVGDPLKHMSADKQVSGAAAYVDDMPSPLGLLHAVLVLSSKAHARILKVDTAPALALNETSPVDDDDDDGRSASAQKGNAPFSKSDLLGGKVVRVLLAEDVVYNHIGAVIKDEEVFASEVVHCVGQVIGVVVGTTLRAAIAGARAVEKSIAYEELPPVLTIEEAVAARSFFTDLGPPAMTTDHVLESGDVGAANAALKEEGAVEGQSNDGSSGRFVTVTGEMKVGGQEHFYLEPNVTLCVPSEGGDEMVVYSSTQNPVKTQNFVAAVCGMAASKVVCRMKRMGGAFGGKETRSVFVGLAAAVAAQATGRPVKICLDRDVDMAITGQRHPFLCRYTASAEVETGKLFCLEAELYSNGGCSLDLSGPVMDRALFHIDNTYRWPHLRCRGVVCKTNLPSNTAFRGFGGPQALVFAEHIVDHLATEMNRVRQLRGDAPLSRFQVRRSNLYGEGGETHFNQVLENWNVPRCMDEVYASAGVAERQVAVDAFNAQHRYRKRGLEVIPTKFGISFTAKFMNQGGALVHVYLDGTVLVTHGGTEMGQGLHTKVCQVAARCFGIPVKDVFVSETATDKVANASPSAASLSTDLYGMATLNACEEIRKRLEPVAAAMMEGASGSSNSEPPPFKAIVTSAYFQRVDLSAHGFYIVPTDRCGFDWNLPRPPKRAEAEHPEAAIEAKKEGDSAARDGGSDLGGRGSDTEVAAANRAWNKARGTPFNYFTQGVAVSEVEVDCLTGDVRILRSDILMDVGQSINPAIDVGQIEGAFVQGWGWLSMEDLNWTPKGQLFTRGPGTYKIPAFDDAPVDFRVTLLDRASNPFTVHSSKAIGEPPFFLAASAFFATKNAIRAARAHRANGEGDASDSGEGWCNSSEEHFALFAPATSERIRMACLDEFTTCAVTPSGSVVKGRNPDAIFQPRGSW